MPLPTPNKGEPTKKFVDRCMGSEVMKNEFPDTKQRYAVCCSQARKVRGENAMPRKSK